MGAREEEKQKMAVILKEVSRRLDVFGKELTVYRELEQDLERKIADLQSLLNISEPEDLLDFLHLGRIPCRQNDNLFLHAHKTKDRQFPNP